MKYNGVLFQNRKFIEQKLLLYGFSFEKERYVYSVGLMHGDFRMDISIDKEENIEIIVSESESGEEYTLIYAKNAVGSFLGEIREQYEDILSDICEKCTEKQVFKSDHAKNIIRYIKQKYGTDPEYLWDKFPNNAVFRNGKSAKWYAAILTTEKKNLGLYEEGTEEILNLKARPERVCVLLNYKNCFPAYHMNKKHWYTVRLNGEMPIENIYSLIDESYETVGKVK